MTDSALRNKVLIRSNALRRTGEIFIKRNPRTLDEGGRGEGDRKRRTGCDGAASASAAAAAAATGF